MMPFRRLLLRACFTLFPLLVLIAAGLPAHAYEVTHSTDGALAITNPANNSTLYASWDSPSGYYITRATVTYSVRPTSSGGAADRVTLYYRTCKTCSWSTLQSFDTVGENQSIDVDLSGRNAVGLRIRLSTGSMTAPYTAAADVPFVVLDEPPFTPARPTLASSSGSTPYQQTINWVRGSNPADVTYELWRQTYDSTGREIADELLYAGTALSYTTTDQVAGRYYTYRVRALSPDGERVSPFSPSVDYWTPPEPTITPITGGLRVSFDPVYPGVAYRIYYRTSSSSSWSSVTTTETTYDLTGLQPRYSYHVQLAPVLPNAGTIWRSGDTTTAYSPIPDAPSALLSNTQTPTSHRLYWRITGTTIHSSMAVRITRDGVVIYEAVPTYRSTTPSGGTSGSWAYYTDTDLTPGTPYTYVLCALNALGVCGEEAAITVTLAPNAPGNFALSTSTTGVTPNNLTLTWTANSNPPTVTYELWRRTFDSTGAEILDELLYAGTALSYTTTDQVAGRYYTYRVRAVQGASSAVTTELAYYTAPIPTTEQVTNQLRLEWPAVYPNVRYRVYYSQNGTSWTSATTTTSTNATISLSPLNRYQVKLTQNNLPNGGPTWDATDQEWYSPYWPQIRFLRFTSPTQTSVTLMWPNSDIDNSARIRIARDGRTVYDGVPSGYTRRSDPGGTGSYYMATWTDSDLEPGTSYTYEICALNALGQCANPLTATFTTLAPTPDAAQMAIQAGSGTWSATPSKASWAEIAFTAVRTATSYKLYITGPETRTLPINASAPEGDIIKYRLTDLRDGADYTWRISAINETGESPQSDPVTFSTPNRTDQTPPSNGFVQINDGAPSTGGTRVRVQARAIDAGSGLFGFTLSNAANGPWSPVVPIHDPTRINLLNLAGGNAFFTDLGGWEPMPDTWVSIHPDPDAKGGAHATIRRDAPADGDSFLQLSGVTPATAGSVYTVGVRYRTISDDAVIAIYWLDQTGNLVSVASLPLTATALWVDREFQVTAPPEVALLSLAVGLTDAAPYGATLDVDFITINEGRTPIAPVNILPSPASNVVEWDLAGGTTGTKTVYVRFVDLAGNISPSFSASITYMLTDTTAPSVTLTINGSRSGSTTASTTVTLEIRAVDNESPPELLRMRFRDDTSTEWTAWEPYTPTKTWTLCAGITPTLCEGVRTVWVEVQDPAGLVGGDTATVIFRIDVTPIPGGTGQPIWPTSGTQGHYNTGTGTLPLHFQRVTEVTLQLDPSQLTGIRTVRYGFAPERYNPWEALQFTKTISLSAVQGIQTIYVQLDDGRQYELRFLLDYTAPEVQVSWAGGATITRPGGRATLVIDAHDNLSRNEDLQVSINGAPWMQWSNTMDITLTGSGLQTVTVRVQDPAGNITTKTLSIFVLQ